MNVIAPDWLRPRRLLYVLYRYPQLSQTFVRDEIAALRRAGANVEVLSLDDPGPDPPPASWAGPYRTVPRPSNAQALAALVWQARHRPRALGRLLRLAAQEPARRRYLLTRIPALARMLASGDPAHVHTHFAWDTATVASGLAGLLGASSSITVHAKDLYAQPPATVRRRLVRYDEVVTVCNFNVGYLQGAGMLAPGGRPGVWVVACGVEIPTEVRSGPGDDVVAVGRLIEKKGFDLLLHALAALGDGWQRATIVGDGPERDRLLALSDRLGLDGRVHFAGALPHSETLARIAGARVFCLPARPVTDGDSDAMPVVIREAMAHAVPVVATRLSGIPESVDEDVGWLVEPDSPAALATALGAALADEPERRRRGRRAWERAAREWTFERQVARLTAVFTAAAEAQEQGIPYR